VGDDVTVLDASGKFVMPGIDPHTHLAMDCMDFLSTQTVDDFFSGQAAALAGGTTMHIDFVIPVNGNLMAGFQAYKNKAKVSCMDYGFHMVIIKWDDVVSRDMEIMVKEHCINSFKFFMAYKGALMVSYEIDALEEVTKARKSGFIEMFNILQFCLLSINDTVVVLIYCLRILVLVEETKGTKAIMNLLILSYLSFDERRLRQESYKKHKHTHTHKNKRTHACKQNYTQSHTHTNTTNEMTNTPQHVFPLYRNQCIEERMHLVWDTMVESGQISATDYVRLTGIECARIFNIYPRKGAILAGSDADIIILNPNSSFEISSSSHHSRIYTNIYEGWRGKGKVEVTIAGGRVVWENDELKVVPGSGKYIEMPPFSYLFNGIEKADARHLSSLRAPVKRCNS
ncbi:LOW QUALITY PROTEIN: Amidohydro_1 domain-containing protein/Amidohydro_5 domain-containing protein, partial [Cephalotus follicularis]